MNWDIVFNESALGDIRILPLLINLVLVLLFGQIMGWHYCRYAQVLTNKKKQARLFVFLAATTMLVILVIKTSLALSLGLVGALSIIRFRTPVKEPEDLAYLFLAVGIGLGFGADQRLVTLVMFSAILVYLALRDGISKGSIPSKVLLNVSVKLDPGSNDKSNSAKLILDNVLQQLAAYSVKVDLRRIDCHETDFNANLVLYCDRVDDIGALATTIKESIPGASVSIIDANGLD